MAKSEKPAPKPTEVDELPEVKAAAEAVRRAREELEKASDTYKSLREEATDQIRRIREKTVGEVVEETLETVRKHPGLGVGVAAMVGFLLGRLFRH